MKYIGEVLPIDGFRVTLNVSLPQNYNESLHHLYQPLIGIEAVHLYELFIHEAKLMQFNSIEKQTHHTLMNHLNVPLNIIYEARLKLEAVGLLHTYKREDESSKLFTYEIMRPFTPIEFFNDIMLTELLERHVGSSRFEQLKQLYVNVRQEEKGDNVTVSFHDVFQTYVPKENDIPKNQFIEKKPTISLEPIDFNILSSTLKQRNIPVSRVLTEMNKRIITQLANLYDLQLYEIEQALLWALTDENTLDIEQFKAACHDLFSTKKGSSNIKLSLKPNTTDNNRHISVKAKSKKEQLIHRFETISPKQLLEDLSVGNHATDQDLKMIREIMVKQGLPPPVMNVLIHFTLLKTNMQLSRPYMEKIAGHWSRANLKTAKEAMEFVLQQTAQAKQSAKRKTYSPRTRKQEVIPDWFKERDKNRDETKKETLSKEERQAQEEMAAILKKYNSN